MPPAANYTSNTTSPASRIMSCGWCSTPTRRISTISSQCGSIPTTARWTASMAPLTSISASRESRPTRSKKISQNSGFSVFFAVTGEKSAFSGITICRISRSAILLVYLVCGIIVLHYQKFVAVSGVMPNIVTNFISLIEFYEIFVIIRTVGLLQNCNS